MGEAHLVGSTAGPARSSLRLVRLLVALVAGLLAGGPAAAQTVTLNATPGLDGYVKATHWLPITVVLENAGETVEGSLEATVGRQPAQVVVSRPVTLAHGARQQHTLFVRPEPFTRSVPVRFGSVQTVVPLHSLDTNDRLLLSVSADRSGLSFLQGLKLAPPGSPNSPFPGIGPGGPGMGPQPPGSPFPGAGPGGPGGPGRAPQPPQPPPARAYVAHTDVTGLYDCSLAYSSVDVIALGNVSPRSLTPAQKTALREWVQDGGTLVIAGGSEVGRLRDATFADLLPVEALSPAVVPSLDALGRRFGSPIPAGSAVVARGRPRPGARVWVAQDGLPLIVSRPHGNGRVLFLAFDYDQAPVRGWAGQEPLWREILAGGPPLSLLRTVQNAAKYGDNIRGAIEKMSEMYLPQAGTIVLFSLAYILCLVPLNYLVLRRLDRRELTWATTPAIVLVFCAIAYFLAHSSHGNRVRLYRLEVLECARGSTQATGFTLLGLFSPRRTRYTLEAPGTVGITDATWFDGSSVRAGGASSSFPRGYTLVQTGKTRVEEVAMNMWSMRIFEAPARRNLEGTVESGLRYGPGGIEGRLVNRTREHLEGGILLVGSDEASVGAMAPGGSVTVKPSLSRGSQSGRARQTQPRERLRARVVDALRSDLTHQAPPLRPMLIAWGPARRGAVRLEGERPEETAIALYLFPLAIPPAGAGAFGITALAGQITASGPNSTGYPDGTSYIHPESFLEREFVLPAGALRGRRLVLRRSGQWSSPGTRKRRLTVSLHDWRNGGWVTFPMAGDTLAVPGGERFVERGSGRLRVRLKVTGDAYWAKQFTVRAEPR